MSRRPVLLSAALLSTFVWAVRSDAQNAQGRWELTGIPTVNWDADERFGYGAAIELYRYRADECRPYCLTIQPTAFLTTGGRRDFSVFVDAPRVRGLWRVSAYAGSEQQLSTPYYGIGNETTHIESLEEGPNPHYYRFGRTRRQAWLSVQRPVATSRLRVLAGAGIARTTVDTTPYDSGTTLLSAHVASQPEQLDGWSNFVRLGLVWDSRDREVNPRGGAWSEMLVQRVDKSFGSDESYTRWTLADRRYLSLTGRLTLANRVVVQGVDGNAPFYDLFDIQTSFKQQEGLGGAKTIRGVPRNRYVGKGIGLWNVELRQRQAEFGFLGKPSHLVLLAFSDVGRVWNGQPDLSSVAKGLHFGYGGGVRLGWGENFTVAVDAGHSSQSTLPIYIGLGYLF